MQFSSRHSKWTIFIQHIWILETFSGPGGLLGSHHTALCVAQTRNRADVSWGHFLLVFGTCCYNVPLCFRPSERGWVQTKPHQNRGKPVAFWQIMQEVLFPLTMESNIYNNICASVPGYCRKSKSNSSSELWSYGSSLNMRLMMFLPNGSKQIKLCFWLSSSGCERHRVSWKVSVERWESLCHISAAETDGDTERRLTEESWGLLITRHVCWYEGSKLLFPMLDVTQFYCLTPTLRSSELNNADITLRIKGCFTRCYEVCQVVVCDSTHKPVSGRLVSELCSLSLCFDVYYNNSR